MIRKAFTFTFIELIIVVAIISISAAIAIPAILESSKPPTRVYAGNTATVTASGLQVRVTEDIGYGKVRCRLDNGPGAVPRYSEVTFYQDELTKIVLVEAQ